MSCDENPYEVVRARFESNVDSFILSDFFRPNLQVDEELRPNFIELEKLYFPK